MDGPWAVGVRWSALTATLSLEQGLATSAVWLLGHWPGSHNASGF